MAKNPPPETKLSEGIRARLAAEERSIHWLARRTGIKYQTLQSKLRDRPGAFTSDELFAIADALGCEFGDLPKPVAA